MHDPAPSLCLQKKRFLVFLSVLVCLVFAAAGHASGTLDPNFGTGGVAHVDFGAPNAGTVDLAQTAVLQSDGKIIVVGFSYPTTGGDVFAQFALARFNVDGTLDGTFGNGGKVLTDLDGGNDRAFAVGIQPDGKIIVGGATTGTWAMPSLVRYNPNGSLDTSFGGTGKVSAVVVGGAVFTSIAIQQDGKIIACTGNDLLLMRYDANGSLDSGFGTAGVRRSNLGDNFYPMSIILQGDKMLVGGLRIFRGSNHPFLVRYTSAVGGLDAHFGRYGREYGGIGPNNYFHSLLIQTDGNILVSGVRPIRYDPNGYLQTVFAPGPYVGFGAGSLVEMPDGKFVGAGGTNVPATNGYDLATVVYNADGSVYSSARLDLFGSDEGASNVFVQNDGKIVLTGYATTNTTALQDFFVARYLSITP